MGGEVMQLVAYGRCGFCNQEVVISTPGRQGAACILAVSKVAVILVPLSSSGMIWYQSFGGDDLRLGR